MNFRERGEGDIAVAKLLLSPMGNPTGDESITDIAAYHVQQGIEKEIKYVMHDVYGIDDSTREFRSHIIPDVINMLETLTDIVVPDRVKEIAFELTTWEGGGRYGESAISVREDIKEAIDAYNEMKTSFDEQIDREVDLVSRNEQQEVVVENEDDDDDDWWDPVD